MSTVTIGPLVGHYLRRSPKPYTISKKTSQFSLNYSRRSLSGTATLRFCDYPRRRALPVRASSTDAAVIETSEQSDVVFTETFLVKRPERVEGKISIRLDKGRDEENWHLSVGCSLPGKWILHWGVHYTGDTGSEWDQPPPEMRPLGSIAIKDYAIETPLQGETFQEVKIDISSKWSIAAINFVLKDEETGVWYQHRGRDFKIPLVDCLDDDANIVGVKKDSSIWSGSLGKLSNILLKPEASPSKGESSSNGGSSVNNRRLEGFYEEHAMVKETLVDNRVSVSVKQCPETAKNILHIDTDLPGDVILHWGICKDDTKIWELPAMPYPAETVAFKNKALRTLLQRKEGGNGSSGLFTLDGGLSGFVFVVKLDDNTWLNCEGDDFYIPLPSGTLQLEERKQNEESSSTQIVSRSPEESQAGSVYTDEIIKEIRSLVSDISSEKSRKTKNKETQETILQEIEKLAAEAYSIFRSSIPIKSIAFILITFLFITITLTFATTQKKDDNNGVGFGFGPGGGFNIPGFGPGSGGYGGGFGGPKGGYSKGGIIRPTMVCKDKGPCFGKKLKCPSKCFKSFSRSGKGYGYGGGGGGCTMDCKKKCVAYC